MPGPIRDKARQRKTKGETETKTSENGNQVVERPRTQTSPENRNSLDANTYGCTEACRRLIRHLGEENSKLFQENLELHNEINHLRGGGQKSSSSLVPRLFRPKIWQRSCKCTENENRNTKSRPRTEPVWYEVSEEEMLMVMAMDKNNKWRKRNIRLSRITVYKEQQCTNAPQSETPRRQIRMNKIRQKLSEKILEKDINKFFRHFESDKEQFLDDLTKINTSYEKFNKAFLELEKLSHQQFNPEKIEEYFKKIGNVQYAEFVIECLGDVDEIITGYAEET